MPEPPADRSLPEMPGDVLRAEISKRGWTQADVARILQRPLPTVNEIIQGKRGITPEMAVALGAAFGNGAEFWARLEADYRLALVPHDTEEIKRRVRLYELGPIKEMEKRVWIRPNLVNELLEAELCRFFEIGSISEEPKLSAAMRMGGQADSLSPAQRAWCFRARHLAKALVVKPFDPGRIDEAVRKLRQLAAYPKEARHLSDCLGEFGIRFVVVEPLASSRIDGAAFWLDERSPCIAVSIRYDRIDAFWFTVLHEFSHVRHGDASVDSDLAGEDYRPSEMKEDAERRADEEAAATLVPPQELRSFMRRVGPLYAKDRIIQFAHRIKMHPGVIVGQLQHRGEIGYAANREMLAKVREIVTQTALTDGYGRTIAPGAL